jgi:hypothetical protein
LVNFVLFIKKITKITYLHDTYQSAAERLFAQCTGLER